ncbi:hypothetical protein LLG95_09400 [bacterium]|nr:hypothetical protein [bacterium]
MNSIHEAIRKFRPDLKLDGWTASARLVPAAAAYPDFIKPETVARGLARPEVDGPPQAAPAFFLTRRQMVSLALVFSLAVVFGLGIALRPAKVGRVDARPAPAQAAVVPMQNTEKFNKVVTDPPAKTAVAAAPVVSPTVPPGFVPSISAPPKTAVSNSIPAQAAAPAKRALAPIKKPAQYVSLQPVRMNGTIAPPVVAAAAAATTSTVAAMEPQAPAAPAKGGVPEILYESDSPQSVPQSSGAEIAAMPAATVSAPRAAQKADAPTPASNSGRIQGIFWDKERPMALLGDDIIEVGSETPFGKVVEINKKFVVFDKAGKRATLAP